MILLPFISLNVHKLRVCNGNFNRNFHLINVRLNETAPCQSSLIISTIKKTINKIVFLFFNLIVQKSLMNLILLEKIHVEFFVI